MKNKAINGLKYTGIVTLSHYISGKKRIIKQIHNKGKDSLFNFLSDCLIGDFNIAKYELPAKISLTQVTDEEEFSNASSAGFIYLLGKPEKIYSEGAGKVRYSFIIPKDTIIQSECNSISLYAKNVTDLNNCMAYCKIPENDLKSQISGIAALVVDWDLIISNSDYFK